MATGAAPGPDNRHTGERGPEYAGQRATSTSDPAAPARVLLLAICHRGPPLGHRLAAAVGWAGSPARLVTGWSGHRPGPVLRSAGMPDEMGRYMAGCADQKPLRLCSLPGRLRYSGSVFSPGSRRRRDLNVS